MTDDERELATQANHLEICLIAGDPEAKAYLAALLRVNERAAHRYKTLPETQEKGADGSRKRGAKTEALVLDAWGKYTGPSPVANVAKKLGIDESTVRRHLPNKKIGKSV